jgi:hypothetical protein
MTAMMGMLVGPALSGLGIATVGIQVVLYVSSGTFVCPCCPSRNGGLVAKPVDPWPLSNIKEMYSGMLFRPR